MIQECLEECARWGDLETQALFMVEGAELLAKRGKTDDSVAMLQVPMLTHASKQTHKVNKNMVTFIFI